MIPYFRSLWRRMTCTHYWQPFRLGVTQGAVTTWGKDGGWALRSTEAGDVTMLLTDRGVLRSFSLTPYQAQQLGNQLRDHALSLGGLPYRTPEDQARREELYRTRALPKGTVFP